MPDSPKDEHRVAVEPSQSGDVARVYWPPWQSSSAPVALGPGGPVVKGDGGWCAPATVVCVCGAPADDDPTLPAHRCPVWESAALHSALDLPKVTARRGGVRFPDPPTHPTLSIRRVPRRWWQPRQWRWSAAVPPPAGGMHGWWRESGVNATRRRARRAGLSAIGGHSGAAAQTTVDMVDLDNRYRRAGL